MSEDKINEFITRVKRESTYHKFLEEEAIRQMISIFSDNYQKLEYPNTITDPITLALQFYKQYNEQYYQMILKGIEQGKIIIDDQTKKSFVDTSNNIAYIKLDGNDCDVFMIVHELAHFIDRNSAPVIIPDEYHFLCEVYAFYMEKKLEQYLKDPIYKPLIEARNKNRMYFESRMMKNIAYQLHCETTYRKTGQIKELDEKKVKQILNQDYDLHIGLINYLLRYPLANILSDYVIHNCTIKDDHDLYRICLQTNLYEILDQWKTKHKIY